MSFAYKEFLEKLKTRFIEDCDLCGKCLRKCPLFPHSKLKHHQPKELQKKIIEAFEGGSSSPEVIDFALMCSNCLYCDELCPVEGLRPSRRSEIIKAEMYASGKKFTERAAFFLPGEKYFAFEVLASLLMKPSEINWLAQVPETPPKTEIVYYLGCVAQIAPGKVRTSQDILSQVNRDFITLGGGSHACCGGLHTFLGRLEEGENLARRLLTDMHAFQPQYVVFWCPTCLSVLESRFSHYMSESITYQHISTFLADAIDRLTFTHTLNKTVTIHDPCHLGRGLGEYEAPRKILARVPGVRVVEMSHTKENTLCCGAAATFFDAQSTNDLVRQRLDEAKECGAEVVTTLCMSCQTSLLTGEFTHGLSVTFLTDLIGEAMGIRYEDKLKKLVSLGNTHKIINAARENIGASKFTVEEMQTILPVILGME